MLIGIKYCGGCNSEFNRGELLKKIKKEYNKYTYEYIEEEKLYDYVIAIQGCKVKCADLDDINSKNDIINLDSEDIKVLDKYL